jgi:WD40 repeat protein
MDACPTDDRLQALLDERTDAAEAAALEQHLRGCAACQQRLELLTSNANDPRWRTGEADDAPAPAFLQQLESQVLEALADTTVRFTPAADAAPAQGDKSAAAPDVPGYTIVGELGRGGMGVVYLARQAGLNRLVALKMILAGAHAGPRELERFRAEAEVVARLEHPHIVQIHAIGEYAGLPFLCLEYLPGGNLARRLAGQPQPVQAAAEMVAILAQAVAFAHQHDIVHRDLKPANILLAADGTPKISDFGLAKYVPRDRSARSGDTVVGTPSYMAPEQALGSRAASGTAVDVYALGAVLYEMLTGQPPFRGDSPLETLVQVSHADPLPPRRLRPLLPRDLETICLKCLEKDPRRRYASAAALADDLRRFRAGEPIVARPVGLAGRAAKWARRRPAVATLLAAVILVTALSFGLLTWLWDRAATNAAAERSARLEVERLSAGVWLDRGAALCEQGEVDQGLLAYAHALELAESAEVPDLGRVARINLATWPAQLVRQRAFFGHSSWAYAIAYSPDGTRILTAGDDGLVKVWDASTGREQIPPLTHNYPVWSIAPSPDGHTVLTACGTLDDKQGEACLWDVSTRAVRRMAHPSSVLAAAFDRMGRRFLTACAEHVAIWDSAETWAAIQPRPTATLCHDGHDITTAVFSHDGKTILTGGTDHTARRWDAATGGPLGKPLAHAGNGKITVVAFHPDDSRFVTAADDGRVQEWQAADSAPHGPALLLRGPVTAVAYSPDGALLAVGCMLLGPEPAKGKRPAVGGEVQLWDTRAGRRLFALPHPAGVRAVAFSPNGRLLLTGAVDGKARFYDADAGTLLGKPLVHEGAVVNVAFSRHGPPTALTASAGGDKYAAARLWDLPPIEINRRSLDADQLTMSMLFERAQPALLLASSERNSGILRADRATGRVTSTPLAHLGSVTTMALSPNAQLLLTGGYDGQVRLWDLTAGTLRRTCLHEGGVHAAAFSPSGDTFWTAGKDGQLRCWATATGERPRSALSFTGRLMGLYAPRDTAICWLESDTQSVRLCRWTADKGVITDWEQPGRVEVAAFRADGAQVLTAGWNETAQLRDARSGTPLGAALAHAGYRVTALAFSPDGALALTGGRDRMARLWDTATAKPLGPPLPQRDMVFAVAFSPDGRQIAVAGQPHIARLWDVPAPMEGTAEEVRLRIEALTGLRLDATGTTREHSATSPALPGAPVLKHGAIATINPGPNG